MNAEPFAGSQPGHGGEQRRSAAERFRNGNLSLSRLGTYYNGIGGDADQPALPYPGEGRIDIADFVGHLRDLLADNVDVHDFLTDLATMTAAKLSGNGTTVSCGVTVIRRTKPVAVASGGAHDRTLDQLQKSYGDGPCDGAADAHGDPRPRRVY